MGGREKNALYTFIQHEKVEKIKTTRGKKLQLSSFANCTPCYTSPAKGFRKWCCWIFWK